MKIFVNGKAIEAASGCSVAALLQQLEITTKYVAVEVNQDLVPRAQHPQHLLCEGDELEVVTLVGGG